MEQRRVDDVRNEWFRDPDLRAKWRDYMRSNQSAHIDYLQRNGLIGGTLKPHGVPPRHIDLEAHLARDAMRDSSRKIVRQRRAGRES